MKFEQRMRLLFFIKNLNNITVSAICYFTCITVTHSQAKIVFVSYDCDCSSENLLNGIDSDTICYFGDKLVAKLAQNTYFNTVIIADNDTNKIVRINDELYVFKYKSKKIIEEKVFLLPDSTVFRYRKFYYNNGLKIRKIDYVYNTCCNHDTPLPPDKVLYRYDYSGRLEYVFLILTNTKPNRKDIYDRMGHTRKGNATKIFHFEYEQTGVNIQTYFVKGKNVRNPKKYLSHNKVLDSYFVTTETARLSDLQKDIQKVVMSEYYFLTWGNSNNKGTQF